MLGGSRLHDLEMFIFSILLFSTKEYYSIKYHLDYTLLELDILNSNDPTSIKCTFR